MLIDTFTAGLLVSEGFTNPVGKSIGVDINLTNIIVRNIQTLNLTNDFKPNVKISLADFDYRLPFCGNFLPFSIYDIFQLFGQAVLVISPNMHLNVFIQQAKRC